MLEKAREVVYRVIEHTDQIGDLFAGIVVRTTADPAALVPAVPIGGLTFGIVLAAIASRLLTALLYGFRPDYVPVAAVVSVVLVAVAALACFVPALRASRIDPMMALRQD